MNKKIAKYIIAGVKAEMQKEVEKAKEKNAKNNDNLHRWWKEEESRADALEAENAALKAELADAKKVIAGYKESMAKDLGIEPVEVTKNA